LSAEYKGPFWGSLPTPVSHAPKFLRFASKQI
jgi:hypothetical protein